jgi:putative transposase
MERSAIQDLVDASLFVVSFRGGQLSPQLFPRGGTYFFTEALRDRGADYLIREIHLLREAFRSVCRAHPFQFDAIVVLPDHLHCIWTLSEGDSNYPSRWRLIKGGFSRALAKTGRPIRRNSKGEYDVW